MTYKYMRINSYTQTNGFSITQRFCFVKPPYKNILGKIWQCIHSGAYPAAAGHILLQGKTGMARA